MNRINIILASYNGESYIREQIESICKNSYKNWKLWVFDDGSKDHTGLIVNEYSIRYPNKIFFIPNEENKGVTRNFLEGIVYVTKNKSITPRVTADTCDEKEDNIRDYYMFADQDDVWMEDKLETTLKYIKALEQKYGNNHVLAVFTDAVVVDENLHHLNSSFIKSSRLNTDQLDLPHILMENKLIGCTVMMNEALVQKLKVLPNLARYHDWWVAIIAATFGHIGFLPKSTLYYRQHKNNLVGNQSFISYIKNRLTSLGEQKKALKKLFRQAEEFYQIYEKDMKEYKAVQVYTFSQINKQSFLKRRFLLIKHGYLKSGLIRNLGLISII